MEKQVVDFFKTFADANRLRLAALLLEQSLTMEEIADRLKLRISDIPRHLDRLEKLDLLRFEDEHYQVDPKALESLSRTVLANNRPAIAVDSNDESADAYDREVVKNFSLPDGRLKEIPSQTKKILSILRHVVQVFEPGTRYTEKQVNEALARFYPDHAALRRYLVDYQLIQRETNGSAYWRA